MFKNPFSFEGRIRRTEYGLSFIIFVIAKVITQFIAVGIAGTNSSDMSGAVVLSNIFLIPFLWFLWAQGAKRCHDVGKNGWWQIIPFYPIYLIFGEGIKGENEYGEDPKKVSSETSNF
jgi:uncharacterized membrane protein YhaH (DUF805 family)